MSDETRRRLRAGRTLGRTLYVITPGEDRLADQCIGMVDTRELAEWIVSSVNGAEPEPTPLNPPAAATASLADEPRFLTGVLDNWHAVPGGSLLFAELSTDGVRIAAAACGALVRVAPKFGAYNRIEPPVSHDACAPCAWTVAIVTGETDRELRLTTPQGMDLHALARVMPDPLIAAKACRAILAEASGEDADYGPDHPATIQLLAAVSAHAPVLLLPEACAEGECEHAESGDGNCRYLEATAGCHACSLQAGGWAGEWEGQYRGECNVSAPCSVLLALAEHFAVTAAAEASP